MKVFYTVSSTQHGELDLLEIVADLVHAPKGTGQRHGAFSACSLYEQTKCLSFRQRSVSLAKWERGKLRLHGLKGLVKKLAHNGIVLVQQRL